MAYGNMTEDVTWAQKSHSIPIRLELNIW